jgi:hypothetical protein
VASLRIRHEQLIRLDFHQQDCSLVGRSDYPNLSILSTLSGIFFFEKNPKVSTTYRSVYFWVVLKTIDYYI